MSDQATKKVCLVIGVGDGVGAAIAKAFALDGFETVITRRARNLPDLEAIAQKIRDQGGVVHARGVDARSEEETVALFQEIERDIGPIEVMVFNIGANVRFAIEATTARVFTKVWEMACFAGFLAGREAAKVMMSFHCPSSRSQMSKYLENSHSGIDSRAQNFRVTEARTSGVAKYCSGWSHCSSVVRPAKWSSWQWVWKTPATSFLPMPRASRL